MRADKIKYDKSIDKIVSIVRRGTRRITLQYDNKRNML